MHREKYFKQAAMDIVNNWQHDRANMSSFWREFFGEGLIDTGAKFLGDAVKGANIGTTASLTGMIGASALTAGLVSAGAGLVIGVAAHTAKSATHVRKRAVESPYRYLTTIEKAGVVFRRNVN
jgi:hypothetical protein